MQSSEGGKQKVSVRYHGLDALRAWAMSMGIVLHAAWIMIPRDSTAPASDASGNDFFTWLCLAIHTFRMQLFFVLAGFFACLLLQKRGIWSFVHNRLCRVCLPLGLFWVVLCPIVIWQYNAARLQTGAVQSTSSPWELTRQYLLNITPETTLLAHLWFLYYLSWAYLLVVGGYTVVSRLDSLGEIRQYFTQGFGRVFGSHWGVLLLAGICAPLLWCMSGVHGIEIGTRSLYLKWPGLISYCLYFVAGWLLFRNVDKLDFFLRGWRWQLALGLLLTMPYYYWSEEADRSEYVTLNYPQLGVNHLRFDHELHQFAYPELRTALMTAESDSVAGMLWQALPEPNRTFVANSASPTERQVGGLLATINQKVLGDAAFAANFDLASLPLTEKARTVTNVPIEERTGAQTKLLNREIIEAGFPGIILGDASRKPYYHVIRAGYAFYYSLTTWLLIYGCLGFAQTFCAGKSRFWRYFSDSSYWMYLAHLPIQFQILLWLGDKPWAGSTKFLVYVFGTIAVLVPSYHFLVRPTWIGWLLNGRRTPIFTPSVSPSSTKPVAVDGNEQPVPA